MDWVFGPSVGPMVSPSPLDWRRDLDDVIDDVMWWDHMMSSMMSCGGTTWCHRWCHAWCHRWCHAWCHVVGPHDVMDDVMMMSWWCHDDVMMMSSWVGNLYTNFCPLVMVDINLFRWLSLTNLENSNGVFVQELNKKKIEFLWDKNLSHL